jgi:hypothetical protein
MELHVIISDDKQKRVSRPKLIDGHPVDEFIARIADPIRPHQNELWEFMVPDDELLDGAGPADDECEIPSLVFYATELQRLPSVGSICAEE